MWIWAWLPAERCGDDSSKIRNRPLDPEALGFVSWTPTAWPVWIADMCGICGEVSFRGPAAANAISTMLGRLEQRGPDSGGMYVQGRVGLGHRRLSILDLSAASRQPMVDTELGLTIVFNGCIYNFRELRAQLSEKGYRFFSDGDTEVILKAYAEWGPRCVERFHGMFAFAISERDSGRVVLARDRLGIKPLYYTEAPGRLRFASTLQALLAAGGVDTNIDQAALHHYMSWHAVVPAPRTILRGIRKLAPATLMILEPDGSRREEVYWSLTVAPRAEDRSMTKLDWEVAVRDALTLAVKRRTVADVPVGVLLSGGLDSSLVVALLAKSGHPDLKTFAIGFETVEDLKGDEFEYSDLVAERFGTQHQQIRIDSSRALDAMPGAISAMSEPMMSHDAVGFYLLSEEISKQVKVVQSGQGADEIFGGYHWYPAMIDSNDPVSDYARVYFDRDHREMNEAIAPPYINGDYSREFVETFFGRAECGRPIDRTLQLDTQIMLVDDPVKRVDNMTMAFGLEARVPFLDHELVELAARIPADLKIAEGGKYILKEAARGVVPDEVIDRPKGYFPVPALKYIRGPFLDMVRDVLEQPAARQRGVFNRPYVDRLLRDPERELTPKGHSKLWQVALLECWMQTNGV
jgi:asparagine synthase (glutamine-hydrolysing)